MDDNKFYQMPEPFKSSGYVSDASAPPPPYPAVNATANEPEQDENLNFRKPNASRNKKSAVFLFIQSKRVIKFTFFSQ